MAFTPDGEEETKQRHATLWRDLEKSKLKLLAKVKLRSHDVVDY